MSVPMSQRGLPANLDSNDNLVNSGGGSGRGPAGVSAVLVFPRQNCTVKAILPLNESGFIGTVVNGQRGGISGGGGGGGTLDGPSPGLSQQFISSGATTAAAGTPPVCEKTVSMKPPATVPTTTSGSKSGDRKVGGHYANSNITVVSPPPGTLSSSPVVRVTTATTSAASEFGTESQPAAVDSDPAKPDGVDADLSRSDNVDDDNVNNNVSCGETTTDSSASESTTVATAVGGETGGGGGGPIRNLRVRGQRLVPRAPFVTALTASLCRLSSGVLLLSRHRVLKVVKRLVSSVPDIH